MVQRAERWLPFGCRVEPRLEAGRGQSPLVSARPF